MVGKNKQFICFGGMGDWEGCTFGCINAEYRAMGGELHYPQLHKTFQTQQGMSQAADRRYD